MGVLLRPTFTASSPGVDKLRLSKATYLAPRPARVDSSALEKVALAPGWPTTYIAKPQLRHVNRPQATFLVTTLPTSNSNIGPSVNIAPFNLVIPLPQCKGFPVLLGVKKNCRTLAYFNAVGTATVNAVGLDALQIIEHSAARVSSSEEKWQRISKDPRDVLKLADSGYAPTLQEDLFSFGLKVAREYSGFEIPEGAIGRKIAVGYVEWINPLSRSRDSAMQELMYYHGTGSFSNLELKGKPCASAEETDYLDIPRIQYVLGLNDSCDFSSVQRVPVAFEIGHSPPAMLIGALRDTPLLQRLSCGLPLILSTVDANLNPITRLHCQPKAGPAISFELREGGAIDFFVADVGSIQALDTYTESFGPLQRLNQMTPTLLTNELGEEFWPSVQRHMLFSEPTDYQYWLNDLTGKP